MNWASASFGPQVSASLFLFPLRSSTDPHRARHPVPVSQSRHAALRGGAAAFILALLAGFLATGAISSFTAEGSVVRGVVAVVAMVAAPLAAAVVGYRHPPTIDPRARMLLLLGGVAVAVVGIGAFVFLAGLIPVGLAMMLSARLLPSRDG